MRGSWSGRLVAVMAAGLAVSALQLACASPDASGGRSAQSSTPSVLAFVGATVIDGSGAAPVQDAIVIVDGDRVRAVGPRASTPVPAGAQVIDAAGRTILPGLADLHTHLQGGWDGERPDYLGFTRYLDAFLYNGVTTILDPGNSMPIATQIRQEIAEGRLRGPRVYITGLMIDRADPLWPPLAEPFDELRQAPRLVKRLAANRVHFVKGYAGLSNEHVRVLAEEARKANLRLIVDLWERNGTPDVVRSGIYAFAHAPHAVDVPEALAQEMRERGVAVISTIGVRESFSHRRLADLSFMQQTLITDVIPGVFLDEIRGQGGKGAFTTTSPAAAGARARFEQAKTNVYRLWRAGALVTAGTDAPYPGVFQGEGLHRELELLVEAGLTPVEAMQAATGNAAKFVAGAAADWGTIVPGKRADLVVVSGRPHERIGDTRTIVSVVQSGRVIDRASLTIRPGESAYKTTGTIFHPAER